MCWILIKTIGAVKDYTLTYLAKREAKKQL